MAVRRANGGMRFPERDARRGSGSQLTERVYQRRKRGGSLPQLAPPGTSNACLMPQLACRQVISGCVATTTMTVNEEGEAVRRRRQQEGWHNAGVRAPAGLHHGRQSDCVQLQLSVTRRIWFGGHRTQHGLVGTKSHSLSMRSSNQTEHDVGCVWWQWRWQQPHIDASSI